MFVAIDDDGTLGHYVCDQYGRTRTVFNGIDYASSNFQIPNYEQVKDFALSVSKHVPHCRLLALDIAIKNDGMPQLIDFNVVPGTYSMWLFQFTGKPAFGNYTDEILEYCKVKQKRKRSLMLYYRDN